MVFRIIQIVLALSARLLHIAIYPNDYNEADPLDALVIDLDVGMPIEDFTHCFTGECRVNVLPILYKLNQVISVSADLAEPLRIILDIMQRQPQNGSRRHYAVRPPIGDDLHP